VKDWVGRVPGVLPFSDQWIPGHERTGRIMPAWVAWIPGHERLGMPGCPVFWLFSINGSQNTKHWVGIIAGLLIIAGLGSMDPRARKTGYAWVPGVLAFFDQWIPKHETLGRYYCPQGCPVFWLIQVNECQGTKDWVGKVRYIQNNILTPALNPT